MYWKTWPEQRYDGGVDIWQEAAERERSCALCRRTRGGAHRCPAVVSVTTTADHRRARPTIGLS